MEFGWTLERAPADADLVSLRMGVEGADWLAEAGEGAELVDRAGRSWWVSGALAWGADGEPLAAAVNVVGDALVVTVDVADAAWPVTVDPVLSAATATFTGEATGSGFGYAVAQAGDVNADGYGDVIVGAFSHDTSSLSNVGRAYVYHGSSTGLETTAATTITGANATEALGFEVAGAGDVNGDGYDDVLVGAYAYDSTSVTDAGRLYVHHGSAAGVSATAATTFEGTQSSAFYGGRAAGAGDVNRDGYDDVIFSAFSYDDGTATDAGRVWVHHGSAAGLSATAALTLTGGASGDYLGYSVASAGDVNRDGYDDVVIGVYGYNASAGSDAGRV